MAICQSRRNEGNGRKIEPSQMAGFYVGRLKARNYRKIDFKIIQNIKPSQMANKSHTKITEITEIEPSQMAGGIGVAALKILRKLYSKLFKIFRAITDGYIWSSLKARNYTKLYSKLNKIEGAITDGE